MYAAINGTKIFFDVNGKEYVPQGSVLRRRPVCFVLHGGPGCDHSDYLPALDPLLDLMQLIYIDYRGNGRSLDADPSADPSNFTLEQNVSDIEALRRYLGLEKIVLLGQSYGGMAAISYAVQYPQNVAALVLITTASDYRFLERAKTRLAAIGSKQQIEMADAYLWHGKFPDNTAYKKFFRVFANLYAAQSCDMNAFNDALEREIVSYKACNMAFSHDLPSYNCTGGLQYVRAPALVIGGALDWICPIECSYEIAAALPKSKLTVLEKSSHSVFNDQYSETITAIKNFIEDLIRADPCAMCL
ncbi:MAG: alpha/beta hydrolase [Termitinemataceae bacterium]|nr:MAG: alpha/beta hydrolase [Termitinemataceae bacterium]